MKSVIVYSSPGCIYCKLAKDFFTENKVEFTEVDLSQDPAKRDEMIEKTGQMAVPIIDIGGELLVGFDKAKISELLGL